MAEAPARRAAVRQTPPVETPFNALLVNAGLQVAAGHTLSTLAGVHLAPFKISSPVNLSHSGLKFCLTTLLHRSMRKSLQAGAVPLVTISYAALVAHATLVHGQLSATTETYSHMSVP